LSTQFAEDAVGIDAWFRDPSLPPLLVRASAGTGKTYRLTGRLLQILLQGAPPETVLATTFTRKAAGEILDRVLSSLAAASDPQSPEALESLRRQVGDDQLSTQQCLRLLKKLVSEIHRIRICTLDSLFTQLAKSFPFELQLPPAWRLTDEIEEVWLRERAVSRLIATLQPVELASLLSMLSKGETKRSIARELIGVVSAAYALARQADSEAWSDLEAPTQPDDEALRDAAVRLRGCEAPQKSIRKKLQGFADAIDSRDFKSLETDTLIQNYAKAKRSGEPVKYGRSKLPEDLDDSLGTLYAAVRSAALAVLVAQNKATGEVLSLYDGQIATLKQTLRSLSFDDVSVRLANRIDEFDASSLRRRMDGSIDHLLLDEFQDTSPAQWRVLRPLAMRVAGPNRESVDQRQTPVSRSFFCVSDTKQAIYGWRGGVAEIFDAVGRQLPDVRSVQQNESFRSSPVIMDLVNQVFKNLDRHPIADSADSAELPGKATHEARAIQEFCAAFPTHRAVQESLPGYARMETCRIVESREKIVRDQACFSKTAQQIAELNRQTPQRSIGVLTRTNSAVGHLIFLLERLGVDVSQEGGNPLIDSPAVELVLSALMMSEHPGDGRWRYHVETSVLGRSDVLSPDTVRQWVTEGGVAETTHRLAGLIAPVCNRRDTERLRQLVQLAIEYEPNATPRLCDFVRLVREKRVERPRSAPVRVMTVHQSKGLEFDAVFLPELDGKLTGTPPQCVADVPDLGQPPRGLSRWITNDAWHFLDPTWQKAFGKNSAGRMTESLCLLYVAMTRARQALYLIAPPFKPTDKKPSALIYQALASPADCHAGNNVLHECGQAQWW